MGDRSVHQERRVEFDTGQAGPEFLQYETSSKPFGTMDSELVTIEPGPLNSASIRLRLQYGMVEPYCDSENPLSFEVSSMQLIALRTN